jgi:hypothetical protein
MTGKPRCYDHQAATVLPMACRTCTRIWVERMVAMRAVDACLAAGYALDVINGDAEGPLPSPTRDRVAILSAMGECDEEFLAVHEAEAGTEGQPRRVGWVRFIYGNSGYDVISDYTVNLEDTLAPALLWASQMGGN